MIFRGPYPEVSIPEVSLTDFIFNSTDLTKGRTFRIASAYIGSWDYGYREPTPTSVKLGAAVAASAATGAPDAAASGMTLSVIRSR